MLVGWDFLDLGNVGSMHWKWFFTLFIYFWVKNDSSFLELQNQGAEKRTCAWENANISTLNPLNFCMCLWDVAEVSSYSQTPLWKEENKKYNIYTYVRIFLFGIEFCLTERETHSYSWVYILLKAVKYCKRNTYILVQVTQLTKFSKNKPQFLLFLIHLIWGGFFIKCLKYNLIFGIVKYCFYLFSLLTL